MRWEKSPPWTNCVAPYRSETARVIRRVRTIPVVHATASIRRKTIPTRTKKITYEFRNSPREVKILAFSREGRALETANKGRAWSTAPSFATKTESRRETTFTGESNQNRGGCRVRLLATMRPATLYGLLSEVYRTPWGALPS